MGNSGTCQRRTRPVARKTQSVPAPRCRLRTETIPRVWSNDCFDQRRRFGAEKQCFMKGNRLDLESPFAQHLTCGRKHQLDITGRREQDRAVDAVVLEVAWRIRVDL